MVESRSKGSVLGGRIPSYKECNPKDRGQESVDTTIDFSLSSQLSKSTAIEQNRHPLDCDTFSENPLELKIY